VKNRMKGRSEVVGCGLLPKNSVTSASAANASRMPTKGDLARKADLTALVHASTCQGTTRTPMRPAHTTQSWTMIQIYPI